MTTIDPRATVLAALHARMSAVRQGPRSRAGAGAMTQQVGQPAAAVLAQRIAAIDRADPDRRRKAVRVVLEAELAREFGPALLNDPAFPVMLDAVQQHMDADVQAAAASRALGDLLLAGAA